jgi:hypothetical protein
VTKVEEVVHMTNHMFERAQRALSCGDLDTFKAAAKQDQGLADLFKHLMDGGRIQ